MFDDNFGKCGPIFKILSPIDSWEYSLCTHYKDFQFTCNMLLYYLVSEIRKSKNVTEFSCWMWQLCLIKIYREILYNLP